MLIALVGIYDEDQMGRYNEPVTSELCRRAFLTQCDDLEKKRCLSKKGVYIMTRPVAGAYENDTTSA